VKETEGLCKWNACVGCVATEI